MPPCAASTLPFTTLKPILMHQNRNRYGYIHSIETCGAVDGPGLRYTLFLQGCLMRCLYCHNRDTWELAPKDVRIVTVEEIMTQLKSYRHYLKATGGGVTATGGEALLQPEFIRDWFLACKQENIHTCLDTNGYVREYNDTLDELLDNTDLVMLDIKQIDNRAHQMLTGVSNTRTLNFAAYLNKRRQITRVRHVIVPNHTDSDAHAHQLGQYLAEMENVIEIELLPYHTLGSHKWEKCGEKDPLEGTEPPDKQTIKRITEILKSYGKTVIV